MSLTILVATANVEEACQLALLCNKNLGSLVHLMGTDEGIRASLEETKFDLIIWGPTLNGCNPIDFIQEVREKDKKIPMIGYSSTKAVRECMRAAGCTQVISIDDQPVTLAKIKEILGVE